MAQALINTTVSPYDSGKAGGDKVNAMFTENYRILDRNLPARILTDGDSIGVLMSGYSGRSPLFWAASLFPFPFVHNGAFDNFAVGSTFTDAGNGLLTPSRIAARASRISACRANGESVIVISQCGTNDIGATTGNSDNGTSSIVANYQAWWLTCKAAGANMAIIMAIPPAGTSGTSAADKLRARKSLANNNALREWCRRNRQELTFCDTTSAIGADEGEAYLPAGGAVGAVGSVNFDILHPSARGAYLQGRVLGPILQRLLGTRKPLVTIAGDQFIRSASPFTLRGNVLGRSGRMFDTGGTTTQVTLSGGGGVTGVANFPSAKVNATHPQLTGTLSGTLAVDIAQAPWPLAIQETGRTDIMCTKLTFSGTPTANGGISLTALSTQNLPTFADGPYDAEAVMWASALTGLGPPSISALAAAGSVGGGGGANDSDVVTLDGLIQITIASPIVATSDPGLFSVAIATSFRANVPVSGSLYIYGMAIVQNPALPAPTTT